MSTETVERPNTETDVPKAGAHAGVSFVRYCGWDALNWHTLWPFNVSAKHARHKQLTGEEATETQVFCGAFHAAMLEPDKFDGDYAIMPKFDGHPNSNEHKAKKREWQEANASKVQISDSERRELLHMKAAINAHPKSSVMLSGAGRNELSIAWRERTTGLLCKGRIDRLCRVKMGVIDPASSNPDAEALCLIDLKGTRAIDRFANECGKYGYHGQLAFYKDGLETLNPAPVTPFIIAIQNQPPWDVIVYRVDDDTIEQGRLLYRRMLRRYVECEKEKRWPGISDEILPLWLEKWHRETESELEAT